ncbi:hypothetical protein AVEN_27986-1 [Araneus ventricosus]|uniref:Reverse transcriptase zinc-binding domain-containing protein n=1 Tax=Araneus ventricosus TaxID=182803 RepID=A0A4Y2BGK6_ARAVE|nr:hypothetical protein AVEN_27986-1 [Araneus ventricosus]
MLATGHDPFPTYLKTFNLRTTYCCGCGELGSPLHFEISCRLTSSFHLTKPSNDLEQLWWKRVLNNPLPRIKIRKLINFISGGKESSTNRCQELR